MDLTQHLASAASPASPTSPVDILSRPHASLCSMNRLTKHIVFTYTQTVTKIPDYCLPGGPAGPHANVPTTSLPGADAFISAVSAALETAGPELDSESEDEGTSYLQLLSVIPYTFLSSEGMWC